MFTAVKHGFSRTYCFLCCCAELAFTLVHYGMELWGCANIIIMQRSQYKILRAITNAPGFATNHTLHTDFNIPYVSDVIHERINKLHIKLEAQPNPLLESILQPVNNRRLKRCWPFDLQGT